MNQGFVDLLAGNTAHAAEFQSRFDDVQEGQWPGVVTVCCSDSRVLQDHVWNNVEPGRIFSCRNIGNRVLQRTDEGDVVSGDVLYPVEHTETETVVVVGHTGCGAVTATYQELTDGLSEPPGIEHSLSLLGPLVEPGLDRLPANLDGEAIVNRLVEYNVDRQVEFLLASDDIPPETTVIGVVYDFQDVYPGRRGEVHVVNVNGETSVERLRADHREIDDRIGRLWEY